MEQAKDFITIEEFEELCAKESPSDPKLDIKKMANRLHYLRAPGNWQVPLVKRGVDERGRPLKGDDGRPLVNMLGRPVPLYPIGYRYVAVTSSRIENHIREAVEDAYRRLSGMALDVDSIGISKVDFAAVDGSVPNAGVKTKKKAGESTSGGTLSGKEAADAI